MPEVAPRRLQLCPHADELPVSPEPRHTRSPFRATATVHTRKRFAITPPTRSTPNALTSYRLRLQSHTEFFQNRWVVRSPRISYQGSAIVRNFVSGAGDPQSDAKHGTKRLGAAGSLPDAK